MAKRRNIWTNEKYKAVLRGSKADGILPERALRSIAKGFDAASGFDLRNVATWTAAQKRKVRDVFKQSRRLQAQEKTVVHTRSEKKLKQLQRAFHGDVPKSNFKVAFVPFHEPKTALPGARKVKPKVTVAKDLIILRTPYYTRYYAAFNQRKLAVDSIAEIDRIADQMPDDISLYFAQAEENQTIRGGSLGIIKRNIVKWINDYDGKKALPKSSPNRKDDPKAHFWGDWLKGMAGYSLPGKVDINKLAAIIDAGRAANRVNKTKIRNLLRRKRAVKRKGK